ncbi:MAG: NADH-quinone oxidoreductase subunit J [Opitutaceae bacterium]|jgi:NADH-quinone oxidoreductase subunit J|nr:NADH-quinone oxidoreductase subunit J [Opitutaceae bacterium]
MAALLFYLFAAITLGTAILVVVSKNAVNSAMFFLLSLMGTASLFVLLDAFLLAVLLVLVYAGAVVALFLFIIMLLDMHGGDRKPFKRTTMVASAFAAILLGLGVLGFVQRAQLTSAPVGAEVVAVGATLKGYAAQLFTTYLLPVQIVGFLLLIAMLGVIVLSKRFEGLEDVK